MATPRGTSGSQDRRGSRPSRRRRCRRSRWRTCWGRPRSPCTARRRSARSRPVRAGPLHGDQEQSLKRRPRPHRPYHPGPPRERSDGEPIDASEDARAARLCADQHAARPGRAAPGAVPDALLHVGAGAQPGHGRDHRAADPRHRRRDRSADRQPLGPYAGPLRTPQPVDPHRSAGDGVRHRRRLRSSGPGRPLLPVLRGRDAVSGMDADQHSPDRVGSRGLSRLPRALPNHRRAGPRRNGRHAGGDVHAPGARLSGRPGLWRHGPGNERQPAADAAHRRVVRGGDAVRVRPAAVPGGATAAVRTKGESRSQAGVDADLAEQAVRAPDARWGLLPYRLVLHRDALRLLPHLLSGRRTRSNGPRCCSCISRAASSVRRSSSGWAPATTSTG